MSASFLGERALGERGGTILRSVVHLHVDSGEPVGSECLARHLGNRLSPASIRNTLAELERLGYLDHPHTSAGRVPTDVGYRFYVDSLMEPQPLDPAEARRLRARLRPGEVSTVQFIETVTHLLAEMSQQVGFAFVSEGARNTFRHIDLVRLPHPRILVVMVSPTGIVTHRVVEIEEEISQDDLHACANYLNVHFAGVSLSRIRARLLELMNEEKARYDQLLQKVVAVAERSFNETPGDATVILDGAGNLIDQADDVAQLRSIFRTFEEKSHLVRILSACLDRSGVRITIGRENPDPSMRRLSLVMAQCAVEGQEVFGIGILGGTRMEYSRAVAIVESAAQAVTRGLEGLRP